MNPDGSSDLLRILYKIRRAFLRFSGPLTLGVRCIVADGEGRILLVRHTYIPGWYLPGGGVKHGESLESAAMRELKEEVGVSALDPPELLYAYANFREWKSDHVMVYVVGRFEQQPSRSFEIAEHGFFDLDQLPEGTTPSTLRSIAEWRSKRGLPALIAG